MAHDDNYEPALRVTRSPDQMDQHEFRRKVEFALDDMGDVYDADDGRTLEEWLEELKTTIHNCD